uniref:Uncharacterized protein n=1 Tax=Rhodochaete parvula TaxID=110510 RepID=A0A220T0G1_9RHOD|nr:hypothetical protein Rhodc_045 [Rhodochaete parvula]
MQFNREDITFSRKQIKTLNSDDRTQYLFYLKHFLRKYNTKFEKFIRTYWQDLLVISKYENLESNSRVFTSSIYEISNNDLKSLAHDLLTGRLALNTSLNSRFFEDIQSLRDSSKGKKIYFVNNFYSWKKNLNFSGPEKLNFLKKNSRTSTWPNLNHKIIMKNLKFTPIFIPANGFNHPVLSVPSAEYTMNTIDKLYFLYFDWFMWKKDILSFPIKKGFVFFNPVDANEFVTTVTDQSPRSSKRYAPLRIFPTNLSLAYKWNRTSSPRLQYRFVPDIKELGDLILKYQYYKNINFHSSQLISLNKFKGVPIYYIEPIKLKIGNQQVILEYAGNLDPIREKCKILFTSLDNVNKVWEKFRDKYSHLSLPAKPKIMVYNLEDYLRDCENYLSDECKNFRVVPSEQTYHKINQFELPNQQSGMHFNYKYKILPTLSRIKLWSKYLLWSLTTAQRPDW